MKSANVAIIGAGPAGSSAAYFLASTGIKVILLDKASFPRDKICGDAVTREGLQVLERAGLADWLAQFSVIDNLRFTSPDNQIVDVSLQNETDGCAGRIIPRKQLDYKLVETAIKAGTHFMSLTRVTSVEILKGEGVKINTNREPVNAQMVILADGSHAPITRQMNLVQNRPDLFAIRQYLEGDIDPSGPLEFHFMNSIIPGYTWMFPMGNGQLNIGLGTYLTRVKNKEVDLIEILNDFKMKHPVIEDRLAKAKPLEAVKGHPLRTDIMETRTHSAHVLVCGDAAGLVSPFTGEGIASGLRSGEAAAYHAFQAMINGSFSARALESYSTAIRGRYHRDQQAGRVLRSFLRYPALLNRAFRHMKQDKKLATLFAQIYLDEKSPRLFLHPVTLFNLFT